MLQRGWFLTMFYNYSKSSPVFCFYQVSFLWSFIFRVITKGRYYSPGISGKKMGQPRTNCKRKSENCFHIPRVMSTITYQNSEAIMVVEGAMAAIFQNGRHKPDNSVLWAIMLRAHCADVIHAMSWRGWRLYF